MPNDKYNGLYIHKELIKGSWYGICSGPKPQVYTGNIDTASNLEDIRNKALYIVSPSSENGTFPVYGHKSAVLTTRYGSDVYLQRLFDIDAGVEWERAKIGSTSWYAWKRVTTEGDASATASAADTRSRNNSTAIDQINKAIGGRTANPNIDSRVRSNTSAIGSLNTDYGNFKSSTNSSINSLSSGSANDRVARDHSNKLVNGDVRQGQLAGIKIYTNQNGFSINPGDTSVRVLDEGNMSSWGFNGSNSVFLVSNANGDLNGAHVEGGTFVPPISGQNRGGWYAVFNGSNNVGILLNWTLIIFNQSIS